jgi:hypothetical protein
MTKEGIITDLLDVTKYAESEEICIRNSMIETLTLDFASFDYPVIIENSVIGTIGFDHTWFNQGLSLKNCIIKEKVVYDSGECHQMTTISNNVFMEALVFWNCVFYADLNIQENIFCKGTSLLDGSNYFETICKCRHNIGVMDMRSELTEELGTANTVGTIGLVEIE